MNDITLSAISLFSGVGMLDEGLRAGLRHMGISHRTVLHVEREAYGASVLAARMEEGSLDAAPIWSDVCTLDAKAWHGRVDIVVAGFPCQDLSVAGRRVGLDGKRSGLFFEVVRIATDCGAELIFLENVAGIASATASVVDETEGELDERAAARVVGELADLGWNSEWITLSAADVGASHGRARWFCLAWKSELADASGERRQQITRGISPHAGVQARPDGCRSGNDIESAGQGPSLDGAAWNVGDRLEGQSGCGRRVLETGNELGHAARDGRDEGRSELSRQSGRSDFSRSSVPVADADSAGLRAIGECKCRTPDIAPVEHAMANASGARYQGAWRSGGATENGRQITHGSTGECRSLFALGQATTDGWESSPDSPGSPQHSAPSKNSTPRLLSQRLNPYFVEWLMGWPAGWTLAIVRPASSAAETELYRSALQQHLSSLLGEQES